jgi:hypothetical protein
MPRYEVFWTEKILHSSIIDAEDEADALARFGESSDDEWVDADFLGVESIRVVEPKESHA